MSPDTTGDLGTVLGVWGHPDDEAYLSAGLMMRALANGHRVVCVTATRGEAGFPADDPSSIDERQAVREAELAACLGVLGVTEHRWLGYGDGRCADVPDEEAVAVLAEVMAEVRPDAVLTFGPDGGTGHPDHVAACRWSTLAFERVALPRLAAAVFDQDPGLGQPDLRRRRSKHDHDGRGPGTGGRRPGRVGGLVDV